MSKPQQLSTGLYRVEGAAKVRVLHKRILAMGRVYGEGEELIVPAGLTVCFKAEEGTAVEVVGGALAEARPEEEVLDRWMALAEELALPSRVMVVGEVDSGKTTFSTYLVNAAIRKGLRVALVDADVGQNDVGWPGTIALAFPSGPISWLGELESAAIYFVGSNTPTGFEDAMVLGVGKLVQKAEGRDFLVVNTDGWVGDRRALAYKCRLVEAVEPDVLVVTEGSGAAESIARVFEETRVRVVRTPTPPAARGKGRELRKLRRELSYFDLLRRSEVKKLKLDGVRFWGAFTLSGRPNPKLKHVLSALLGVDVHVEDCGSAIVLAAEGARECERLHEAREQLLKLLNRDVYITCLSELRGLLVGLVNEQLEHEGVGVVEEVDVKSGVLRVRTPFDVSRVKLIIPGRLRLTEEGGERSRGPPPLA